MKMIYFYRKWLDHLFLSPLHKSNLTWDIICHSEVKLPLPQIPPYPYPTRLAHKNCRHRRNIKSTGLLIFHFKFQRTASIVAIAFRAERNTKGRSVGLECDIGTHTRTHKLPFPNGNDIHLQPTSMEHYPPWRSDAWVWGFLCIFSSHAVWSHEKRRRTRMCVPV